jgi:outer membrane protein TolC
MSRQFSTLLVVLAGVAAVMTGCSPQQPFYFHEDGDLSHYIDRATEIDYPDVEIASLDEVTGASAPLTIENPDPTEIWEMTLEEAIKLVLHNSKVIRLLPQVSPNALSGAPESLFSNPEGAPTVYDPALAESGSGFNAPLGVEAAISDYDTEFDTSVRWYRTDQPANVGGFGGLVFSSVREEEGGSFQAQLRKKAATGGNWFLRHNVDYLGSNSPIRAVPSDWTTTLEAGFVQPLLKFNGVQVNRITGPPEFFMSDSGISEGSRPTPGFYRGVMIARINTDIELTSFENQVRNLLDDVERTYWTLYLRYRTKEAMVEGRDKALETWRKVRAEFETGTSSAQDEAQARNQYFEFKGQVTEAQSQLYSAENNLRYLLGLAPTDGRLIRPADEPTAARVSFDWCDTLNEALVRNPDLRQRKWRIKQRELELIAAKNQLLPEFNAGALYRWRGLGDDLIDPDNSKSNAYGVMTGGRFQEWQLALNFGMTLGFRKELTEVRHAQLNLTREKAVLGDMELELTHQLSEALRDLDRYHGEAEDNYQKLISAEDELSSWEAMEKEGLSVRDKALDRKLDAQRRVASAKIDYYRDLALYNTAVAQVHFRKGSLLEYNGVYLAEGPWPQKAYFDATRRARARDASLYLDYGFTRPKVISRGEYEQHAGTAGPVFGAVPPMPESIAPEVVPAPAPEPAGALPPEPTPPEPNATSSLGQTGPHGAEIRLSSTRPEEHGVAKGRAQTGGPYDLGSLDLKALATTQPNRGTASVSASSDVRQVSYEHEHPTPRDGQAGPATNGWKSAGRPGARREPVANSPAAEADRNASGWKGVQR